MHRDRSADHHRLGKMPVGTRITTEMHEVLAALRPYTFSGSGGDESEAHGGVVYK